MAAADLVPIESFGPRRAGYRPSALADCGQPENALAVMEAQLSKWRSEHGVPFRSKPRKESAQRLSASSTPVPEGICPLFNAVAEKHPQGDGLQLTCLRPAEDCPFLQEGPGQKTVPFSIAGNQAAAQKTVPFLERGERAGSQLGATLSPTGERPDRGIDFAPPKKLRPFPRERTGRDGAWTEDRPLPGSDRPQVPSREKDCPLLDR